VKEFPHCKDEIVIALEYYTIQNSPYIIKKKSYHCENICAKKNVITEIPIKKYLKEIIPLIIQQAFLII